MSSEYSRMMREQKVNKNNNFHAQLYTHNDLVFKATYLLSLIICMTFLGLEDLSLVNSLNFKIPYKFL